MIARGMLGRSSIARGQSRGMIEYRAGRVGSLDMPLHQLKVITQAMTQGAGISPTSMTPTAAPSLVLAASAALSASCSLVLAWLACARWDE